MKEIVTAFGAGAAFATLLIYMHGFLRTKLGIKNVENRDAPRYRRRRALHRRNSLERLPDQVEALERQYFQGMDRKLNLSEEQINQFKRYLCKSLTKNQDAFDGDQTLEGVLKRMKMIRLIDSRSYGRIATILNEAGIDASPITWQICRLTDSVADLREGIEPRDFEADMFEYDGIIIHCEEDREDVLQFIDNVTDLVDIPDFSLCMQDEFDISQPQLQSLATVFTRTRFVYVYVTQKLSRDRFCRFMADMALTDSLMNPENSSRIVPIWTTKERVRIMELQPFTGLKYWLYFRSDSDKGYFKKVFKEHVLDGRHNISQRSLRMYSN